jgi:acyl-CoA thioester hydrolase
MYTHETSLRVRYGETDQMGFVYYGVYAQYYEVGRVELLRSLGVSYKTLEESGYELPVVSFSIEYKQPAFYDDKITVKTTILEMPSSKITFWYECFNDQNKLLNKGEVVLVFVKRDTKNPCRAPAIFIDKVSRFL